MTVIWPYVDEALTADHLLFWFSAAGAADALAISGPAVRIGLSDFERRRLVRHDSITDTWMLARPGSCSTPRQIALQLGELALVSARLAHEPLPEWLTRDLSPGVLLERLLLLRVLSLSTSP